MRVEGPVGVSLSDVPRFFSFFLFLNKIINDGLVVVKSHS